MSAQSFAFVLLLISFPKVPCVPPPPFCESSRLGMRRSTAAVSAGALVRAVRRQHGLRPQLSQNMAAVLQSAPVTTWVGRADSRKRVGPLSPVAAEVLETSGEAVATIEAHSGPAAFRASGAAQKIAKGAAPKVKGAPATPLTRSVAHTWLKERKVKQEAAIIEAKALLQGDATGAVAAASWSACVPCPKFDHPCCADALKS